MKKLISERIATCEGYRLNYKLLSDKNCFTIHCVAFDASGRLTSQYCTDIFPMDSEHAGQFFRLLADNCVFPVHIREILTDCRNEWDFSA